MSELTRREAGKILLLSAAATWVNSGAQKILAQGLPGEWMGSWIWTTGEDDPFHFFLMARQTLNLESVPSEAKLDITAADRYMLYINGEYVGRGPARSDPFWKSYDTYDVASRLRPGKNVAAVLAYHYGCANCYTRDERAGLFVQMTLKDAGAKAIITSSGEQWRVCHSEAWARDVRLVNNSVGVTEVYDANREPADWVSLEYDDSSWPKAYVIPERQCPWSYLERRQTPMMEEAELLPVALAGFGEVESIDPLGNDVPERLAAESHFPLEHTKIENPKAVLRKGGPASVLIDGAPSGHAARAPFMIVDFGRPVFGFPRVVIDGPANAVVEMTYGPTLVGGRVLGLMQGVRYGDRYITKAGKQTWQVHEYKQFRFLEVVVRNTASPLSIESINLVSYTYPAERKGRFACSDQTLTKLWQACVDTTYLHMEDMVICDAIRERRGWTGDGGHGLYGIFAAFGDIPLTERYFQLMVRGQLPDGMLRMLYPGSEGEIGKTRSNISTEASVSTNPVNIPQFALFYPLFLGEYHRYCGKRALVENLYPSLVRLEGWCREHSNQSGLLYNLPNWNFVDWVATDMRGANFETNALYYKMLVDMSAFAEDLGKKDEVQIWRSGAEKLKNALQTLYWNPHKELYVDSIFQDKQSETVTELANGMALLWDIAAPDQQAKIVGRLADSRTDVVRATPLYFYYVLEGLIKAGAVDVALQQMAERYTRMVEASDAPTIWEDWNLYEHHGTLFGSQVHSGGVGAAWTLSKHVLGVSPLTPGTRGCRIEPQFGKLTWAQGRFPWKDETIQVDWKKDGMRTSLEVALPNDLEAELVLPRKDSKDVRLVHNGKQYDLGRGARTVSGLLISEKSVAIRVTGGKHNVELGPTT
jgi:alpha-L-rhamnosidase